MFKRILYLANVFGFPMWCTFFKFSNVSVRIIIKHQYPYQTSYMKMGHCSNTSGYLLIKV